MKHFERLALLAAICTLGACNEETYVEGDIKTIAATDVTDKSAVCGGTLHIAFQGSAANLAIQETGVAWAMTEDQLRKNNKVTYVPTPSGGKEGNFSCQLEGLKSDTTYYFRAYANLKNAAKTKRLVAGDISKFTTLSPAGIALETLSVTSITRTTAVVGGSITAAGRPPYVERGVCYATAAASREPDIQNHTRKPAPGEGAGEYSATLTGLTEGTTYYVRAYATNGSEVAYGKILNFTTTGTPGQ
jgi:hypothetical protein